MLATPKPMLVLVGAGPIGIEAAASAVADGAVTEVVAVVDPDARARRAGVHRLAGRSHSSVDEMGADIANVALVAFSSRAGAVAPTIVRLLDLGCHVVTTCEELAFPADHITAELSEVSVQKGRAVVVTGANPGFAMDRLPLLVAEGARDISRISVTRRVDTSTRRQSLVAKSGYGLTVEEFERSVHAGSVGHVGLEESARLLARSLGWEVEAIKLSIEPVLGPDGVVLGQHQELVLTAAGARVVEMSLTMAWRIESPVDLIDVEGDPDVRVEIVGGYAGDQGTTARVVRSLRAVHSLPPGFYRPTDLPLGS